MKWWAALALALAASRAMAAPVAVNQLGFPPDASKIAALPAGAGPDFWLEDAATGEIVLRGPLSAAAPWSPAAGSARLADFTRFDKPGRYILKAEGAEPSPPIVIRPGPYAEALAASYKAFFLTRASAPVEARYAGRFARPPAHPDTLVYIHASAASPARPEGTTVSAPGGWYDAGDYNKYTVNGAVAAATLLHALEDFGARLTRLQLDIPESANTLPDVVDELLWQLDWLASMHDPSDGGAYHKLSTLQFAGVVMPHTLNEPRYMIGKSASASYALAAVLAQAARVLEPYRGALDGRLERYLAVAHKAFTWAEANPKAHYQQPADVRTGAYARADDDLQDERFWALAELYSATGERQYLKELKLPPGLRAPDWAQTEAFGIFTLLRQGKAPAELLSGARAHLLAAADRFKAALLASGYGVAMVDDDFWWGSNAIALGKAMVLIQANSQQADPAYTVAAQGLFDYVLGRNPLGYSFVTGFGAKAPLAIHHRISAADTVADPLPGLLVGGPQPHTPKDCEYEASAPALRYRDHFCSFSTNEVAINWNALLVYTLTAADVGRFAAAR